MISIHLMLMLIIACVDVFCTATDFNTSHVNVNPELLKLWKSQKINFNTSHVNVNHCTPNHKGRISLFQYISC